VNALSWAREGELLLSGGDDTTCVSWTDTVSLIDALIVALQGSEFGVWTTATQLLNILSYANPSYAQGIGRIYSMHRCYPSHHECAGLFQYYIGNDKAYVLESSELAFRATNKFVFLISMGPGLVLWMVVKQDMTREIAVCVSSNVMPLVLSALSPKIAPTLS
jgi:hypothetical protein